MKDKESEFLILQEQLDQDFKPENFEPLFQRLMMYTGKAAYYNILIPLVMQVFSRLLSKRLLKKGLSVDKLDFFKDFPLLREYDPHFQIQNLHKVWNRLTDEERASISSYADMASKSYSGHLNEFITGFKGLMDQFGSFSESGNDFSYPHWNENPEFVLKLIQDADSPYHQKEGQDLRIQFSQLPRNIRNLYKKAGNYRVYREMISAEYTKEYGMFRKLFTQSGTYLEKQGKLNHRDDVFFLTIEEQNTLLHDSTTDLEKSLQNDVMHRKNEMTRLRDISLPSIIYGEAPPPLDTEDDQVLSGIPTSPGLFSGKIVVVNGYDDFKKDVDGAILVIPFADVGWTPILYRAGAIVSESGGMLSHAAIVARELSIPSISSVDHVCQLKDGLRASVDGYNGIFKIID
jgi:pyruvate,water dikinase